MTALFGLRPDQIDSLRAQISRGLEPDQRLTAWIFGSRARGSHRPHSDVDLLLDASPELSPAQLRQIREHLDESDFPFKVDLVTVAELFEPYRVTVLSERKLLFAIPDSPNG